MSGNGKALDFKQPDHGQGGTSSAKNKSKVGFTQPSHAAGKTSAKKNPGKVGFSQPAHGKTSPSAKKNPGKVGFDQPNPAKKSVATGVSGKAVSMPKMGKGKAAKVSTNIPFKYKGGGMDSVLSFRKKKYGV